MPCIGEIRISEEAVRVLKPFLCRSWCEALTCSEAGVLWVKVPNDHSSFVIPEDEKAPLIRNKWWKIR